MKIRFGPFKGRVPRLDPEYLPDAAAQIATNCRITSGNLVPYKETASVSTLNKVGTVQKIYWYNRQYWFHWLSDVDVAPGPIKGDTQGLVYYTGDGAPKLTYAAIGIAGPDYPTSSYALGVPAPAAAPTAALVVVTGSITGATQAKPVVITSTAHGRTTGDFVTISGVVGMTQLNGVQFRITVINANSFSLDNSDGTGYTAYTSGGTWTRTYPEDEKVARVYCYTYVCVYGNKEDESAPNEVAPVGYTGSITAGVTQHVTLSGMSTGPSGSYNATKKYIYRSEGGIFYYVGQVAIGTTTFTDTFTLDQITANGTLQSEGWIPPQSDLKGLTLLPNGCMSAFREKEWYITPPYQPHAWPDEYQQTVGYKIVGQVAFGNHVLIATEGLPYIATGDQPDNYQLTELEIFLPCVSKRSMVDMGAYAMYASIEGLVVVDGSTAKVITGDLFTPEQWKALSPSTMLGVAFEGKYYGFYNNGTAQGFVFDYSTGDWIDITGNYGAAFYDMIGGALYLTTGNSLLQWDAHATTKRSITYKPKKIRTPPFNFGWGKVIADTYPVTFSMYADGALKVNAKSVSDGNPFRLPSGFLASTWEVEVSGTNPVKAVMLSDDVRDLV